MRINQRHYPYPVLAEGNNAYALGRFQNEVKHEIKGYDLLFQFKCLLDNESLKHLVETKKALYTHHVECQKTCYRKVVTSINDECNVLIPQAELDGHLQVCSFITSAEDIPAFTSSTFSPHYQNRSFHIDKGCILAYGQQFSFHIEKDNHALTHTGSIFAIQRNYDSSSAEMTVNTNGPKIVISIPNETFSRYAVLSKNTMLLPVLHSMVILPALTAVLSELKEAGGDNLYIYEDYLWFRSLCRTAEKLNISITSDALEQLDVFKAAQQLLDTPLTKALENLCIDTGDQYED